MQKDELQWLEYGLLEKFSQIKHATLLRSGGVSDGPYASLNLGTNVGDHLQQVNINRKKVSAFLRVPTIYYPMQTHSKNVAVVGSSTKQLTDTDALITKEKNIGIGVLHADCQAALFFDPQKLVIGVAHAGYKGLLKNIYQNVITTMQREFHTDPKELIVCISPGLCVRHAEYKDYRQEFPKAFWEFQKEGFFDFKDLAKFQLLQEGVLEKNIELSYECTACDTKNYFSYRRDKVTGRHGTVIALK